MLRPPLAPSARPPRAPSGLDLDAPNSVRSEDTDDTPESTERSDGAGTPRRKPTDKDKDKDPPPSRVRVTVRVRPEVSDREQGTGHLLCQGGRLWLVEGGKDADGAGGSSGMASPRGNKESTRQFVFDAALPPLTTQEEVFNATCLETGVLKGVTEGFNGCVMCYGQTGAGKTHTLGNAVAGQEGIVPRALRYLLDEEVPPPPPPHHHLLHHRRRLLLLLRHRHHHHHHHHQQHHNHNHNHHHHHHHHHHTSCPHMPRTPG